MGITIGGVRHRKEDSAYIADPTGEYVQNPTYSTCVDRDGDGYIRTSTGLGNVLPWTNEAFNDTNGGVSTAADECIINYMRTAGTNARTVAVDKFNRVYIGGYSNYVHEMYDPAEQRTADDCKRPADHGQPTVAMEGIGASFWVRVPTPTGVS